jgi:hypothetical protein
MRIAVIGPLEVRNDDGALGTLAGAKERSERMDLLRGACAVVERDLTRAEWDR